MFCPRCKTEYVDGVTMCADCGIPLVETLPSEKDALFMPLDTGRPVPVFCTEDSYDFINAAEALKEAGIPFHAEEKYTGEFTAGKRMPPPYKWTIFVDEARIEAARGFLLGMDQIMADGFFQEYEGLVETENRMDHPVGGLVKPVESRGLPGETRIVERGESYSGKLLVIVLLVVLMGGIFLFFRQ